MKQIRELTSVKHIPYLVQFIGGNAALERELTEELKQAELNNNALYIRYEPGFLQRMQVSRELLPTPGILERITLQAYWENWGEMGAK